MKIVIVGAGIVGRSTAWSGGVWRDAVKEPDRALLHRWLPVEASGTIEAVSAWTRLPAATAPFRVLVDRRRSVLRHALRRST